MQNQPHSPEEHFQPQWQQFVDRLMMQVAQAINEGWAHEAYSSITADTINMVNQFIHAGRIPDYAALQCYLQQQDSLVQLVAVAPSEHMTEIVEVFVRDLFTAEERPYWLGVHVEDNTVRETTPTFQQLLANPEENIRRLSGHTGLLGIMEDAPCVHKKREAQAAWN